MAKNKKPRNHQPIQTHNSPVVQGTQVTTEKLCPAEEVSKISTEAWANANDEDLTELENASDNKVDLPLEELIKKCQDALTLLNSQVRRATQKEESSTKEAASYRDKRQQLEQEREKLKRESEQLRADKRNLDKGMEELTIREKRIVEKEETITKRELDADAGFMRRNERFLAELIDSADQVREQFKKQRELYLTDVTSWDNEKLKRHRDLEEELAALRKRHEKSIEAERAELKNEEEELRKEKADLKRLQRQLRIDRDLLNEEHALLEEKVQQVAAAKIEQLKAANSALAEQLQAARSERDCLNKSLDARAESDLRFGNRTPDQILNDLQKLREENSSLKDTLSIRPGAEALTRLEELEREQENWQIERYEMLREISELRQDVTHKRIAVTELESLRNHKIALEASNELLSKALEEEVRAINERVKGANLPSPFPACDSYDRDTDLLSIERTTDEIPNLESFVEDVRNSMALERLFYSISDVRSFLAGMSMSRLHLLQGISGTGKTSLPYAFSKAIGAGHSVIEVQAGWRDRQDLIGYFNTFEKRFYEAEFLKSLYKASCPKYADRPFIIVLDEMNLSHPEQYFADVLSALEQPEDRRRLTLMSSPISPAPSLLSENGQYMSLPRNVWFVGTANHDETTKDFADKTYDRSHVMELPRHPEHSTNPKPSKPSPPISFTALQVAFDRAVTTNADAAKQTNQFFDGNLSELLHQRFNIGWGNRLEKHVSYYVPVVIASGGSKGEAADHILATKILRKLRDRHDTRAEHIKELSEKLTKDWSELCSRSQPTKSLGVLRDELSRMGQELD